MATSPGEEFQVRVKRNRQKPRSEARRGVPTGADAVPSTVTQWAEPRVPRGAGRHRCRGKGCRLLTRRNTLERRGELRRLHINRLGEIFPVVFFLPNRKAPVPASSP